MRRLILFAVAWLSLSPPAAAQVSPDLYCLYWFDGNYESPERVDVDDGQMTMTVDASALSDGLHTLNYRIGDDQGAYSALRSWLFMKTTPGASGPAPRVTSLSYWLDDAQNQLTTLDVTGGSITFTADASSLDDGLHQLKYFVTDDQGRRSDLHTWLFMKAALPDTVAHSVTSLSYWLDEAQNQLTTLDVTDGSITFTADASSLDDGLHQLKYFVTDDQGRRSDLHTWLFMKAALPDTVAHSVTSLSYWLDDAQNQLTTLDVTGGSITFTADASALDDGLHQLKYYVTDDQGRKSDLHTWLFMKATPRDSSLVSKVETLSYWFDNAQNELTTLEVSSDSISFAADATPLEVGLHQLKYYLTDTQGRKSALYTWLFLKDVPRDTLVNRVTSLSYWIDDAQDRQTTLTVTGDSLSFAADASSLDDGIHQLKYYLTDAKGQRSAIHTWLFMKSAAADSTLVHRVTSLTYWLDSDQEHATTLEVAGDSLSFSADASSLDDGLHQLMYYVTDETGQHSALHSWLFIKSSIVDSEPARIAWYEYWWNDHTDMAVRQTVDCDSTVYELDLRLEVPMYAKNDGYSDNSTARLSILFGDDAGRCSPLTYAEVTFPDELAPETEIEADCTTTSGSTTLTWHIVNDQLAYYNVYYSKDGEPFVLWLPNTTKTTAVFEGQTGSTYRFAATAVDKAGNRGTIREERCAVVTFTDSGTTP